MSELRITHRPSKNDPSPPRVIYHPPTAEEQALLALGAALIRESYHGPLGVQLIGLDPIIHQDPRLRDYRVYVLLSDLTPDDPTDWSRFIVEWVSPPQEYRLWRSWVLYGQAPLLGEIWYEPGLGWRQRVEQALWLDGLATAKDGGKIWRGLGYALQTIRRPGRETGRMILFDSREAFAEKLREAQGIVRRRLGTLPKRAVARQMGITPSTFYAYLRQYPGVWEGR
jgi:hypothetical protein